MLIVANMRDNGKLPGVVIEIHRGKSVLGNPFVMKHGVEEYLRDKVCDKYEDWLDAKVREKDVAVCAELNRIYSYAKTGVDVYLMCYCAPKRCHGDYIKKIIEYHLRKRGYDV
jgi:hypothetical protein